MSDMSIPVTYLTSDRTAATATSAADNGTLDSQAFLHLLIAQLKNQDPSSPTDTATILTQTTQLAQMEGISQQTAAAQQSFDLQQRVAATSTVGREVTWADADGNIQSGVVSSVSFYTDGPVLQVGTAAVALEAIRTLAPAD